MKEAYRDFNQKRMFIFQELIKAFWNGEVKDSSDLEALASSIKNKYGFDDSDIPFIRDHMRVAMGQDPKEGNKFTDELNSMKSNKITHPIVTNIDGPCEFCDEHNDQCVVDCKYEDSIYRRTKEPLIVNDKCLSCGQCVSVCDFGAIADKIEFIPIIDLLKDKEKPVYATIAPAAVGQFGDHVSMGHLRSALKLMGFKDLIEVALFADILTIKEAFEFNKLVRNKEDFFLTSCCCPIWFNMVKKSYPDLYKKMSPSVSPMIASGRILKRLYDDAKVVFIGPCIAKKSEAKESHLEGAIDYVLNFKELKEIFEVLEIDLESIEADDIDHASLGGRLYARTGGVSFSVKTAVNRLEPTRVIKLKPRKVHGVKECKGILDELRNAEDMDANFIEGMGCLGGCVGGPRTNIDLDSATKKVNDFGEESFILTPFDNKNIIKILENFNIYNWEGIIKDEEFSEILTRDLPE